MQHETLFIVIIFSTLFIRNDSALVFDTFALTSANDEQSKTLESSPPFVCEFKCSQNLIRAQKESFKPTFDGCGSGGLYINLTRVSLNQLSACCNRHDICYSDCNQTKSGCDFLFLKCMTNQCAKINIFLERKLRESIQKKITILFRK